jgi:hypothetical protein
MPLMSFLLWPQVWVSGMPHEFSGQQVLQLGDAARVFVMVLSQSACGQ